MEENNNYENQENQENTEQTNQDNSIPQVTDEANIKLFCILGYLWILWLIPFLMCKNDKFAKHHTNQACVLFIFETIVGVVIGILGAILGSINSTLGTVMGIVSSVVGLLFLLIMVIQMVAVNNKEEKEIPLIGKIKIIK